MGEGKNGIRFTLMYHRNCGSETFNSMRSMLEDDLRIKQTILSSSFVLDFFFKKGCAVGRNIFE